MELPKPTGRLEFRFPVAVSILGTRELLQPLQQHLALYNPDFQYPRVHRGQSLLRYHWLVDGATPWPQGLRPELYTAADLVLAELEWLWSRTIDPQRLPAILAKQQQRLKKGL
jgi:hypothetical protein